VTPADRLSYVAYNVAGILFGLLALPLLPLLLLTRHGRGLGERLAWLPPAAQRLRQPLWVHAASVGEVLAAQPLIEALRRTRPEIPILVSTTSASGRDTARGLPGVEAALLLPADIGWIVGSAMRRLRPRCLVIVETEIWPALVRAATDCGVPVVIVSGRISARAAAHYAWVRWLTRAVLSQVAACAMQSAADAARIVTLGAPTARVQVLGSLKFARSANTPPSVTSRAAASTPTPAGLPLAGCVNGRPLLIAASTHADEEQMVLEACAGLWAEYPDVLLLLAPRRPERFGEVDLLLARAGVTRQRRSELGGPVAGTTQVLLLDTLGELPDVLPVAQAVFVGGTIAPIGGHNVLEPAVFGKPVAFGPSTENVAAAAEALLAGGAATRVTDAKALRAEWGRLLRAPATAVEMGARGRAIVAAHAGVAERICELVWNTCRVSGEDAEPC